MAIWQAYNKTIRLSRLSRKSWNTPIFVNNVYRLYNIWWKTCPTLVQLHSCRDTNTYLLQTKSKSYNTPIMWLFDKHKIKPSVYPVFPGKVGIPRYLMKKWPTVVRLRSCTGPNTYLLQTKTKSYNTTIPWLFDKHKKIPSFIPFFQEKLEYPNICGQCLTII